MALIATLTGDWSNAAWTLGTGFTANSADHTRMDFIASTATGFTDTVANYDLTGSVMSWKNQFIPPTSGAGGPGLQLSLEWRSSGTAATGHRLIRNAAGTWTFYHDNLVVIGSTFTDLNVRANPYMRLRESGGTTYFEYSPDGVTWSEPDGTQHIANVSGITTLKPRWQPPQTADGGLWTVQELNGTAPAVIANDPTIFFMQATSTGATAAVNASPIAPTVSTGDLSILVVQGKASTVSVAPTSTTPSGWTAIGTITNNGTLASGIDTGSNSIAMYYRTDSGYGNPTISTTGFNSMSSAIMVFRSTKVTQGGTWDVSQSTTGSDTSSGANIAITGAAGIAASAGDLILANISASGDAGTPSAYSIAGMSGATLYAANTPINRDVSTNQDSRHVAIYDYVISGSSSSAPTSAYTNSSSTTAHGVFLRIRDLAAPKLHTVITNPAVTRSMTW